MSEKNKFFHSARLPRAARATVVAGILGMATLGAVGDAVADPAHESSSTIAVSVAGWPNISGLSVLADGVAVTPVDGVYTVGSHSHLTFFARNVELTTVEAKPTITVFDLAGAKSCGSTPELGKLLSLLLALDSNGSVGDGTTIPTAASRVRLADLSESSLLSLEESLTGHSVALNTALLAANAALDNETWTESLATRTPLVNDMSVLQSYLDRVLGAFAYDSNITLEGFSHLAPSEIDSIPATLKGQGMSFDGNVPVFSWRYGLQRTDPATYKATLSYPLDFPADVQAIFATFGNKPDYGHIGDIDIADGKLYAALEDEDNTQLQDFIAVYDAKTLQYTGEKHAMPTALHTDGIPWVAVDPKRHELYTVTWSGTAAGSINVFNLKTFALIRTVPLQHTFDGRRVQGAKIYDGMMYAVSDSHDAGGAPHTNRKYIFKVDTVTGSVMTIFSYDEPNRTEVEGLGFDPSGTMHVLVISPYTTPYYATGTNNPKPFLSSYYSINGDDWNPGGSLRHYTRTIPPLRNQLCTLRK
jgi:hypothetical protein